MIKIVSVNISEEKGTPKHPVEQAVLTDKGIVGDAHAGSWHRQVSILSQEVIEEFSRAQNRPVKFGEFAENITISGIDLKDINLFDRLYINDVILEVTQIGKECHGDKCAIFNEIGVCAMPKEGVFARVLNPGVIKPGDAVLHVTCPLKAVVITTSDRAARHEYEDKSGPAIEEMLREYASRGRFEMVVERIIVPDEEEIISDAVCGAVGKCDILITTGGTGLGQRDVTVDVVEPMLDKKISGIMEMVRNKYGQENPNVYLSRSVAGTAGQTVIFCLPGSLRAVKEYMAEILKVMTHALFMLRGINTH